MTNDDETTLPADAVVPDPEHPSSDEVTAVEAGEAASERSATADVPSARPGFREWTRGTPGWVRWAAAAILAAVLVLGVGAVGFAIGQGGGGHGSEHGQGHGDDRVARGDDGQDSTDDDESDAAESASPSPTETTDS